MIPLVTRITFKRVETQYSLNYQQLLLLLNILVGFGCSFIMYHISFMILCEYICTML